ncbi:c-type cytochrome biogenesis protein CcmI [Shewanella sedimentimangrovi]|uniref:C-type cytochrome biogenesis protein CcmI n=1 Tax=Shewanella sedimentimangrovi TaxID=2814293 RepID=A0ABX7R3Z2_9GAMM|nr:c-type cytochrome biogenesis protein CcmI [Shewanella sedimentimangrovi]QSX37506.1 c-type cytochrome biogenesis protein CcmI [Shewanella sedimentimangrovi]
MTTFWILIALVVLVGLVLIWIPHFRQQKGLAKAEDVRQSTNLALYKERLANLELELTNQSLDQSEFDALKAELELSLLQDIKQGDKASAGLNKNSRSLAWPILMSVMLLAVTAFMYHRLGAFEELANPPVANDPHAGMNPEQLMAQRLKMMEAAVASEPENSQAWFSLGHAYISAGQYDKAMTAFDKVMELVGTYAEMLGPKATALYYKNDQQMTPEVQALIDQALALDPKDPSTLLLVGMDAFFSSDFTKAITAWETILTSDRPDVDREALANAIATARMRMQDSGAMPNDATHRPMTQASELTVTVSVKPELATQVQASDTLFVFARTTDGERIPLAVTKVKADAMPMTVKLDDSSAMSNDHKLSGAKVVDVIALLSKSGTVRPQAGDLQGRVASVKPGEQIQLTLDVQVH